MKGRTIIGAVVLVGTLALTALLIYLDQIGPWIIGLLAVMYTGGGVLVAPEDFRLLNPLDSLVE